MAVKQWLGGRLNRVAARISERNRDRKWQRLTRLFPPTDAWRVIDVGFAPGAAAETDNYFEKHYPHAERITALTIDDLDGFGDLEERYPGVHVVSYDGEVIPFEEDSFELLWSNAVVEHVGDRAGQVSFLLELDRVAKRHFVTTPNRWFLFEVHTKLPLLHYLPKPTFDRVITRLGMGWAAGDYMHLMSRRQFEAALRGAGIRDYRIFANRFMGLPMDYVAVW